MISIFKRRPKPIHHPTLGILRYKHDGVEEFWEVAESSADTRSSVNLDFCAVFGTVDGPDYRAIDAFCRFLRKPQLLWALVDETVLDLVRSDIEGVSVASVKNHFYIRSLTVGTESNFEVGLHAKDRDIFIELFVRDGRVSNMERDDGCCSM